MSGSLPEIESVGLTSNRPRAVRAAAVAQTWKAPEVEGWLDLYFYRPLGYQLARLLAAFRWSPTAVSFAGAAIGALGGHFYFYPDLRLNLLGFALQAVANVFDNADGQLARLTNQATAHGAFLDGCADYLVFLSVYLHLGLRYLAAGGSPAIWLLVAGAAVSHALQSMIADYHRVAYLRFSTRKMNALPASSDLAVALKNTSPRAVGARLALRGYRDYLRFQERLMPLVFELRSHFGASIPEWFACDYRKLSRPLLKWGRLLSTNFRMLLLLLCLLAGHLHWFLWSELTLLNLVLLFLVARHRRIDRQLLRRAIAT